jgi:hypothetical protein
MEIMTRRAIFAILASVAGVRRAPIARVENLRVAIPAELLAKAQAAAAQEHITLDELVSNALERWLPVSMKDSERKGRLYLQHPDETPELIGVLPYLIHPPSKLSSTVSWIRFRDRTLLPMLQHRPDDPNLPNFLKQVEAILTWRAGVLPQDRFWKAD